MVSRMDSAQTDGPRGALHEVQQQAGRRWVVLGALLGCAGVAAGAFGAHGLRKVLSPELLAIYHTGARYHLIHALALVLVGALAPRLAGAGRRGRAVDVAGAGFALGVLIFSGSLYVLAISGQRWLGAITPIGGVAFMVGWLSLAWAAWRCR